MTNSKLSGDENSLYQIRSGDGDDVQYETKNWIFDDGMYIHQALPSTFLPVKFQVRTKYGISSYDNRYGRASHIIIIKIIES